MYKIKRCKHCSKQIHIRQKGNKTIVNNKCIHFTDVILTKDFIANNTYPSNAYGEPAGRTKDMHLCVDHNMPLQFQHGLKKFTDLYFCPKCKNLHDKMNQEFLQWWMRKTHNKHFKHGDVKLIVSPSYNQMKKWRWIK